MVTATGKRQTSVKSNSHGNEIIAVILLVLAVMTFLSLISFTANDLPPNSITLANKHNWIGFIGAYTAYSLFSAIGFTAYFVPALLGLMAWHYFRSRKTFNSFLKILGYLLLVFSTAGLLRLFIPLEGGIIGKLFAETILISLIGRIGAGIFLFALGLASFLMITNASLASFFGSFGMAFENFGIHLTEWLAKRRISRAEKKDETPEKPEKPREAQTVKTEKAKPTISLGDVNQATEQKTVKIRDSVAALFEDLRKSPEKTEEKTTIIEEEIALELPKAESAPTISAFEEPFEMPEEENPFPDLIAESQKIPITPIQQTGELDTELIDEIEAEKPVEKARKPQNFENYILPSTDFLTPAMARIEQKDEELLSIAHELTDKTKEFNVTGRVMHICQGPVVTTYEFKPDPGVKYSRVTGLADDLCLALKAESIRIDRIPGKAFVGIEVPNRERETIQLREVIESKKFKDSSSMLSIALGKSIDGLNYVADLAKMPHLLIAGATGAGKSVGVNTLIVSILYKAKPDDVKLIMVDPKQVELGIYADIPHLATPIITDPKRAAISLKWAVGQMERRYKDLAGWGVRNIDGYNAEVKRRNETEQFNENGEPWKKLPFIVIIIDELADLMMVAGKEVEESITRLAQMARAVGIHLVLATQRPSVDVITGLIKANFPSRISFRVSSKVDSRTIIDANGAESLLGKGDMLFLPPGTSNLIRVHGAFVDEKEIAKIVEHIKTQGKPEYDTTITKTDDELDDSGDLPGKKDPLFWDAVKSVVNAKRASTSLLQRHLRIGYGRAAAILDAMVREGYIGEMDGSTRARPILQKAYEDLQDMDEMNNQQ
ncbi:MAG: DNA translocase FtsK 4TM domain-containing protein [Actinomycetota bacterium]